MLKMTPSRIRALMYFIILIILSILILQWCSDGENDVSNEVSKEPEKIEVEVKDDPLPPASPTRITESEEKEEVKNHNKKTTCFYRLRYVIDKGKKIDGADNNGQFITFTDNGCYESDKYGTDVGNGNLAFIGKDADGLTETFRGRAYWGDECTFIFTSNRKSLHIDTPQGWKVVYYMTNPPEGMTTCSLLRSVDELRNALALEELNRQMRELEDNQRDQSNNTPSSHRNEAKRSYNCPSCHGQRKIVVFTNKVAGYGLSSIYKECHICHQMVDINGGVSHEHICTRCNGTGKISH